MKCANLSVRQRNLNCIRLNDEHKKIEDFELYHNQPGKDTLVHSICYVRHTKILNVSDDLLPV